jgi:long-chain fatty acid transport protein
MRKIGLLSLVATTALLAGGYKIPETSTNAVALGAANIAHNHENADAAYYNPAKMVFMKDTNNIEADVMYIGLDKVKYQGTVSSTGPYSLESETESFIVPSLHYVSPKLGDNSTRIGVSIVAPGGLSKRWQTQPAKTIAEEFSLEITEINPTAAFKIADNLAFAAGFRIIYSNGTVKSNGAVVVIPPATTSTIMRDMQGDSVDMGYNLALAYQPTKDIEVGVTYRSNVNLNIEGDATLSSSLDSAIYSGGAKVSIPLPATLAVAAAYTLPTKTTLELVYERTYWSAYEGLDFDYSGTLASPILIGAFDLPKAKNWHDTNTYRLGITQELDTLTLMAGLVIDETPAPDGTLSFELPDTDSTAVSLGGRFTLSDKLEVGVSALYSMHKSRSVTNTSISGEFSDGNILLISAGLGYKF